jgi:diguanylate cyclase (GGDEF)-like protein
MASDGFNDGHASGAATQRARSRPELSRQTRNPGLLSVVDRKLLADESLERALDSVLSQDGELERVVQTVGCLCEDLRSNGPQPAVVCEALRLALRCAVSRSLIEREVSLALTDDLTDLHNRRGFMALAAHQMKLARRSGQGALLFFADVDNLKHINDTFGHREGDRALLRAAVALSETFRDSDVIARIGGDEFAVLALEAGNQNPQAILRRMADSLAKINAVEPRYEVALSIGSARFNPLQAVPLEELIAQADEAMYAQKRARQTSV